MPCRLCLPATLIGAANCSRASMGFGPSGVAVALRVVLQRNILQSQGNLALQHLQRLQRLFASYVRGRRCGAERASAYARGFGGVASVASVANEYSIYISVTYLQHGLQRLAGGRASGVAARSPLTGSEPPAAIKYPRIFKGLTVAAVLAARSGRYGVLAVSASPWRAAARRSARAGQGQARAVAAWPKPGHFELVLPPVASEIVKNQALTPHDFVSDRSAWGVDRRADPTPPSIRTPTPRNRALAFPPPAWLRLSRPREGLLAEVAKTRIGGAEGSGVPGLRDRGAAKTGVLRRKGSGNG